MGDDPIDSTHLFARALDEERLLGAGRLLKVRLVMGGVLLVIFLGMGLFLSGHGAPEARAAAPVMAAYVLLALVLMLAVRLRPSMKAASWYAVPLLDLPTVFVIQYRAVQISATPDLSAGMTLAGFLLGLIAAQLSMQPRILVATAVMEVALEAMVCARWGQWHLWPFAVFLIGFGAIFGAYVSFRVHALLRRVADGAAARVRELEERNHEVRVLNDELRRQIGDRARQLATALARLSSAASAPRQLTPGDVIEDRYRVGGRLGAGGMGVVYRVERVSDGRPLALKVLNNVADREALARFAREAQIAAELDHPNVVSVLDVDVSHSGMLFIVMELVAGSTLADQRSSYSGARWAVPILRQIAAALAAMHARGIVHRDLKPSNVLVDGDVVKVADFGIASLAAQPPDDAMDATVSLADRSPITRTGAFMGTPLYMAPELEHGAGRATSAADVFSLGVVAYELLAGRLPFTAPPVIARLQGRGAAMTTPLADVRSDLPPELVRLVDRCLLESPDARPAAELVAACLSTVESQLSHAAS